MTTTDGRHLWEWLDELTYYPVRPATYGADPNRPDPNQPSRYEIQATLRGGWPKTGSRKRRRRKR